MTTTFKPMFDGRIVEITEGCIYATPWTIDEATERAKRLFCQVDEYSTEAVLAKHNGHDPAPFVKLAQESLAMAEAIRTALGSFVASGGRGQ